MKLARVIGTVVTTVHHPAYDGKKTLLCQPMSPAGEADGAQIVAMDRVQAGVGDLVLVLKEGTGVRQLFGETTFPVRSVIVGVVDEVTLEQ